MYRVRLPISYLLCNAYMLCVPVCHKPFNNAATHFLPRFGIATDRHQHWVAYRRRFQALADMKLKQAKGAFLDQLKERFPKSATPNQLTLEKCGPLERTVFMHRF